MTWFINLELYRKIILVSLVMMGCAFCWGAFNSFLGYLLMSQDNTEKNRVLVESVTSSFEALSSKVESGEITEQDAQTLAKEIVGNIGNGKDRYFLVTNIKGDLIATAANLPPEEMKNVSSKNGKTRVIYQKFAKIAAENKDGGEVSYSWPKTPSEESSKTSYVKLFPKWGWVVSTGNYMDDIWKLTIQSAYLEFGFVIVFAVVLTVGTIGATRILSRPLVILSERMSALASGKLDVDVPYESRKDEVGLIAKAFKVFRENAIEKDILEKEQDQMKIRSEHEKKAMMKKLADEFEAQLSGAIKDIGVSAQDLRGTASKMAESSNSSVSISQTVSMTAAEANSNVQTVAAATEQLSASSKEISRQISSVAEKSNRAAAEAHKTNQAVNELNVMADSIGEVVAAIKGIADQTNLLALNATIEAARAGDAGKGFAVVADEVKKLAMETAQKTGEIDSRVANIQEAIRLSTQAMHRIITDVQDIDNATASVATAVGEQNAATAEIGRNIYEASHGTERVSQDISSVEKNAEITKDAAHLVEDASDDIAQLAKSLDDSVHKFLAHLKA